MTTPSSTGFMVLHSNQLEGLRDVMVAFIRKHPLPPLSPEVVLVQSNGMKHWLELALAKELGICAATQIELPSTQLWQIYRTVLGTDAVPEHMPLDKSPLVWRIMRRLPALLKQQDFEPLARYLLNDEMDAGGGQQQRMYQLAMQLADVLDGYQNYRADWLEDWAQGRSVLRPYADATQHVPLPAQHAWQAALWRDVLEDLKHDLAPETDLAHWSRAQVHAAFLQTLQNLPTGTRIKGLPERLMVFGVTSLPMQTVQALAALGRVCQVLMLVQNPCQYHWGHVVESRQPLRAMQKQRQRNKPGLPVPNTTGHFDALTQYELHTQSNPLLAAWGKHGRDYLHLLDGFDAVEQYQHLFSRIDVFADPVVAAAAKQRPPTHLERLQSDILNLSPAPAEPEKRLMADDSIEMLQTHGVQREVEVLHDKLLAWFDADPKLKPSDIMVMVPDMAVFAPHIHAVFSRYANTDIRHIPYSVADTTPRTEPLVQALDKLMQLPQLHISQLEWQSWFDVDAVRERFGLDVQDVAQLGTWLQDAGVRWGLDAQHRAPWGIQTDTLHGEQNSWLFGMQRLLLGYATGALQDDAFSWRNTLPLHGVGGLDAHVMDGLLQWLRHIEWALLQLRQDHTPAEWVDVCRQLIDKFFKASTDADERLLERAMAPLETWLNECALARFDEPVTLQVLREHWMNQLQQPAMHQRFFGGGVQFATLMPMRSIPFQVVCLLGMNDADYPRRQTPRDFDLMRHTTADDSPGVMWRAGDRSRREDDRYLFLEALLSAREKLYISWQGRRATDHEVMPPSVLVSQLIDHLNACWSPAFDAPLQPLQAFSPQYFNAGSDFRTYASDWQPKAVIAEKNEKLTNDIATGPTHLTANDLRRLLKQPVDVFFRDRLRTRLDTPNPDMAQEEPFALDKLQTYTLVSHMVFAQLKGASLADVLTPLRLQGHLALAGFGAVQEKHLQTQCQTLADRLNPLLADWPNDLPVQSADFTLGKTVLQAQWANADVVWKQNAERTACLQIDVRAGSVVEGKAKHRVPRVHTLTDVWVSHLIACASGLHTTSLQVGLNGAVQLNAIDATTALAHLQELVEAYQAAWRQPLPVARQAACAYLIAEHKPELNPLEAAEQAFVGHARQVGEHARSAHLKRVFDGFEAIAAELPAWAHRLYGPMVAAAHLLVSDEDAEGEAA